jgi:polysaccharide export outer membrane protein
MMGAGAGATILLVAHLIESGAMLAPAQGASAAAAELPAYEVGPGDVLEVSVEGRPELSRLATVQPTGAVRLPRAGDVVVSGLSVAGIAVRLAPLLASPDLPAPRVSVRVKEYQSQFVWVRGAVARPGRKPLRSGTRLVDALLDAGGFTAGASGEVVVERAAGFEDGSHERRFLFRGTAPGPQELAQLGLPLAAGDVVGAAAQQWISVSGAVRRPGRYPLGQGLTLSAALAQAGGPLRKGERRASVRRRDAKGVARVIEADLDAIRDGRAPDPVLLPDDELAVGGRR